MRKFSSMFSKARRSAQSTGGEEERERVKCRSIHAGIWHRAKSSTAALSGEQVQVDGNADNLAGPTFLMQRLGEIYACYSAVVECNGIPRSLATALDAWMMNNF